MSVEISYHSNEILAPLINGQRPRIEVGTNDFVLSADGQLVAFASACWIVLIQGEDDRWSLYHGSEVRRDSRTDSSEKTFEEFMQAWRGLGIKAKGAYAFGACLLDGVTEVALFRGQVLQMVGEVTSLPSDRILVSWNEHEEGETDVVLDSSANTIRVNQHFWEE